MTNRRQRVVVLGASPKSSRYSNRAVRLLRQNGHEVVPVNPGVPSIDGIPAAARLSAVRGHVDTLTVYVSAKRSSPLAEDIVQLRPGRVIFNPGAENPGLAEVLGREGIPAEAACTLVLLNTGQF